MKASRSARAAKIRVLALAAVIATLASGCASLQGSGTITSVPEDSAGSSQMQIWPSPPTKSDGPTEIVSGFLEAARSGPSNQGIAADYLTGQASSDWQTDQKKVIVLADYSESYPQTIDSTGSDSATSDSPDEAGGGAVGGQDTTEVGCPDGPVSVTVSGNLVGELDKSGLYSAYSGAQTYTFTLTQTKAGCRISSLPSGFGVLMERSDFESSYSRHTVYYQNGSEAQANVLVPAQVYLPSADSDLTAAQDMASLIVQGVPHALVPALADPITAAYKNVTLDSSGTATVTIDSKGGCTKYSNSCQDLATQLAYTFYSLSTKVSSLILYDVSSGQTHQAVPASGSSVFAYGLSARASSGQDSALFYAISADGKVEAVSASGSATDVKELPIGTDKTQFSMVSAETGSSNGRGGEQLALLGHDGKTVDITRRQPGGTYSLTQVYPTSAIPIAGSVQQMSWDTSGDLWFTVKIDGVVSIYRYGGNELSQVTVNGLASGQQITQVAAAPDGDRVAVGLTDGNGYSIAIAAAVSSDDDGSWQLNLADPEFAASSWNSISEFDWYSEESLAVLGIQSSSQSLGLYEVYADGSAVYDSLTEQPVQASPPSDASQFVWNATGQPIAEAAVGKQNLLYELSVEGETAQPLSNLTGTWPSY